MRRRGPATARMSFDGAATCGCAARRRRPRPARRRPDRSRPAGRRARRVAPRMLAAERAPGRRRRDPSREPGRPAARPPGTPAPRVTRSRPRVCARSVTRQSLSSSNRARPRAARTPWRRASCRCARPGRRAGPPRPRASSRAAIATGSCAPAMAVFMSTPSQPSSIAMAASEAVPTPASTMTGTVTVSRMIWMLYGLRMPRPEPIGAPSGITHGGAGVLAASWPSPDRRCV